MIRGKTLTIGREDRLDVAEGTGSSGVTVHRLKNVGKYPVWIGRVGDGFRLDPGEQLDSLSAGSADRLRLRAEIPAKAGKTAVAEVQALIGYEAIHTEDADDDED